MEELVQENLEDCTVFVHDIIKNNNVRMRAISIERKNFLHFYTTLIFFLIIFNVFWQKNKECRNTPDFYRYFL